MSGVPSRASRVDCRSAAADRQPVDVLDAAPGSRGNSARTGSAGDAASRLLPRARGSSLHDGDGDGQLGQQVGVAWARMPVHLFAARSHSSDTVSAGDAATLRQQCTGSSHCCRKTSGARELSRRPSRIPRPSCNRLEHVHCRYREERDAPRGFSVKKSHTSPNLALHSNSEHALVPALRRPSSRCVMAKARWRTLELNDTIRRGKC